MGADVSDYYDFENNPEGLTDSEMAAMQGGDDGVDLREGASDDSNDAIVEGIAPPEEPDNLVNPDGTPLDGSSQRADAQQAVEAMASEAAEEEDDEPVTYTQDEMDAIIQQRDALAREKQELKKSSRAEREKIEERIESINSTLQKLTAKEEVDPEDMTPEQRIEMQNAQILKDLQELKKARAEDEDSKVAAEAASSVANYAMGAEEQHIKETGQTVEQFRSKLEAVRRDLAEDYIDDGLSEKDALAKLNEWELNLITRAHQEGKNPAAIIERRFSRKKLVADNVPIGDKTSAPNEKGNGSVARKNMERVKAGQKAVEGRGSNRSATGMVKLTYDTLNGMSKADMDHYLGVITGTEKEDELDIAGHTYVPLRGHGG